ncbi:MAG: type II toxin-antitoxin system RelE/ParE family toxin [Bryobacteraceae bacterium]
MAFRVKLTEPAKTDAEALYERLIEAAPLHGPKWYNGLIAAIETLQHLPGRCPHAPENGRFPVEIRHLLYGRKPYVYRVLFTIQGDTVHVLRIRGPRQKRLEP